MVNTAGLTNDQARLARAYVAAELDALLLAQRARLAMEIATAAATAMEDAAAALEDAKRAFSQAVPDWESRLSMGKW